MKPYVSLPLLQRPTICPFSSHTNPIHALPTDFLKIHCNISLPSTSRSSKWSLSLRFPHQNPVLTSPVPHTCHTQADLIALDLIIRITFGILTLLAVQFPPIQCYVVPVWLKFFLSILFSKTFGQCSSLNMKNQISHPYKTTGKIIVLLYSVIEYLF
jgi:hypothetical protein